MPELSLRDSIITSLSAQEPWPNDVKLYQPYEVEQILLPDNANCLAVQAFLKISNLPFDVEMRWNAEFMSPSGRVPFIKCGAFVVSELEPIVQFASNKGVTLTSTLSTEEKAEMRAYMSLVTNVLQNAELYISWVDNETFNAVTKVRNSSVYPWPLGWIQTRSKRSAVLKRLKALHWHEKTMEQVLYDVEQCCNSLSQKLGERDYFFGIPTALDALVYGHMRALLSAYGPKAPTMIKPITSPLLMHTLRMAQLTNMKLTPQEDYLISQATYIAGRYSPDDRSRFNTKSKLGLRSGSFNLDNSFADSDVYGFKPFDKKQIVMMTDGKESKNKLTALYDEDKYGVVTDILQYIIGNVHKSAIEIVAKGDFADIDDMEEKIDDDIEEKMDEIVEKHEFLLVNTDYKDETKPDVEYLTTIDETSDNSLENSADLIDVDEECVVVVGGHDDVDSRDEEDGGDDETIESMLDSPAVINDLNIGDYLTNVKENYEFYVRTDNTEPSGLDMTDSSPTELDALVFGHVFTVITTRLPCRRLAETVRKFGSLVALAKRVDEQYFKRP